MCNELISCLTLLPWSLFSCNTYYGRSAECVAEAPDYCLLGLQNLEFPSIGFHLLLLLASTSTWAPGLDPCSNEAATLENELPPKQPQRTHWVGWRCWPICQSMLCRLKPRIAVALANFFSPMSPTERDPSSYSCGSHPQRSLPSLKSGSLRYSKERGSSRNSTSRAKGIS